MDKAKKKLDPLFSKDFLDKIVDGTGNEPVVNLCRSCHNVPICNTAHTLMTTYDNLLIGQLTVQCPFFVSHADIAHLDRNASEKRRNNDNSGKDEKE